MIAMRFGLNFMNFSLQNCIKFHFKFINKFLFNTSLNKFIGLLVFVGLMGFDGWGQTFNASSSLPLDLDASTLTNYVSCANPGTKKIDFIVSGLPNLLNTTTNTLRCIKLSFGECPSGDSYSMQLGAYLKSPSGTCVTIFNGQVANLSTVARGVSQIGMVSNTNSCVNGLNIANLKSGYWINSLDVTGSGGYFSTGNDLADLFRNTNPNGTWTLYWFGSSSNSPCITNASLVFGNNQTVDNKNNGENCSTAIDYNGISMCVQTNGKSSSSNMPGWFGPGASTFSSSFCQWNGTNNNDVWIKIQPKITGKYCINISGLNFQLQSIVVTDNNTNDSDPCTQVPKTATNDPNWQVVSCPNTGSNGPIYYGTTSGTDRNQNHCWNAIAGQTYYLVVDGNGGAETPFYIYGDCSVPNLVITNPVEVCYPNTVNLTTASVTEGSNLYGGALSYWVDADATIPLINPNAVNTSGTFYVKASSLPNCPSVTLPVKVTIKPKPSAPTVSSPITYCRNAVANVLTATASLGGTLNWYGTNATGGTAGIAPTPTTTTTGTISYYVSETANGCEGPRSEIKVNVVQPTATLSAPDSVCVNSSNNVSVNLTETGPWSIKYKINNGAEVVVNNISSSPYTLQAFTPLTVSTTSFQLTEVSGTVGGNVCQGSTNSSISITANSCNPVNFGSWASALYIQKCSNQPSTFYNTKSNFISTASLPNNLGTYVKDSGNLKLNGVELWSFKKNGADVCSVKMYYAIYNADQPRPSNLVFNSVNTPFFQDCSNNSFPSGGQCSSGDQKWQVATGLDIDLTTNATGNWIAEVYYEVYGNDFDRCPGSYTSYDNNNGNNYTTRFTIINPTTISYSDESFCQNVTSASPTVTGNSSGVFSSNPIGLSIKDATGVINPSLSNPGTYTVTYSYKDAQDCSMSNQTTVIINPPPTISTTGTATSVCFGSSQQETSLIYSATTNSPTSYSIDWNDAANTAGLVDQASTNFSFVAEGGTLTGIVIPTNTPAATYSGTMTITNANGCTSTQVISVTVEPCSPFQSCNLVVYSVGDGTTNLNGNSNAMPVKLLEINPSNGSIVQSINSLFVGNNLLTAPGNAVSQGYLNSYNGYTAVPGLNLNVNTTNSNTNNNKVTSIINGGFPNLVTRIVHPITVTIPFTGDNYRSVVPTSASTFYAAGKADNSTNGVWYYDGFKFNPLVGLTARNVEIFNNQLYVSQSSAINEVGTGTPTLGTQALNQILTYTNASIYDFSISPDGCTMYVADNGSSSYKGVTKWKKINGTWTFQYTYNSTPYAYGIVVDYSGANDIIYATTSTSTTTSNRIEKLIDSPSSKSIIAFNSAQWPITISNYRFAGIDFTPNTTTTTSNPISTQPVASASLCNSETQLLSVSESSSNTYQWYSNTVNSICGATPIAGATSASYTPPAATTSGTTYYFVKVATNCYNVFYSNIAAVTTTINPEPKVINTGPVCSGNSVTVKLDPIPAESYSYSWTVPSGVSDPGNVASFTTLTAGTYKLVTTINNCSSPEGSTTVTIKEIKTSGIQSK